MMLIIIMIMIMTKEIVTVEETAGEKYHPAIEENKVQLGTETVQNQKVEKHSDSAVSCYLDPSYI